MIKAIFFDIDGTLLSFKTHKIPSSAQQALYKLQEKGIKLFIATGRHKSELNCFDGFPFDGYVTMNGQYCFNNEKIIFKNPISKEAVQTIVSLAEQTGDAYLFFEEERVYLNKINEKVEKLMEQVNVRRLKIEKLSRFADREIFQIVSFVDEEQEKGLHKRIPLCDFTRWNSLFIDINPKGGSKREGILKMLEQYSISPEEIMAIGDGENDITMLQLAKYSVAMGNASDNVKSQASYVTSEVDDDGILKALQYFKLL